ncbi:MAG: tRNA lysidine(34) synthetase TilS [Propionibacteriaceae bacterium]|nr:tRNA lysidine(34) synthetase TilS [Propionibacteriaceae bacterium]
MQCLESTVPVAIANSGMGNCRIGLSGGADSLALTAAMAWARDHRSGPLAGVDVSARVIDHGLQPGSHDVAVQAAQQAKDLGIDGEVVQVEVDPTHGGMEAAAREVRYAALAGGPPALILLAHTLDDQAETVLLGMARGSGVRSLAGMPARRDQIVRPFLTIRRADTQQACRDWGLDWWQDPANEDPSYARSRVRSAMDTLDQVLGPGLAEGLVRTADLCREDADFLDDLVDQARVDPTQPTLDVPTLIALDTPIRHRLLLRWLRHPNPDGVTRTHVLAVECLLTDWHGQKAVSIPGGHVTRENGRLIRSTTSFSGPTTARD